MAMKKWKYLLISAWMISFATPALASRSTGDGAVVFSQQQWEITQIDVKGRTIVINDTAYSLDVGVKVHTADHKPGTLSDLRAGMRVGYRLSDDGRGGQPVISEIWVSGKDQ